MIRFLKNLSVPTNKQFKCYDMCCTTWRSDGYDFFYAVEVANLEEGGGLRILLKTNI